MKQPFSKTFEFQLWKKGYIKSTPLSMELVKNSSIDPFQKSELTKNWHFLLNKKKEMGPIINSTPKHEFVHELLTKRD